MTDLRLEPMSDARGQELGKQTTEQPGKRNLAGHSGSLMSNCAGFLPFNSAQACHFSCLERVSKIPPERDPEAGQIEERIVDGNGK